MLRRILALKYIIAVAVVLGFCLYVSHEDQKAREQYEQECNQFNAGSVTPAPHSEDCDKGAENAARHLPRWYRMFGWPEGITTWAILLTLLALAEQTSQTRRAADATADAANAAYGSVRFAEAQWKLMIEEKRARLDLSLQHTELDAEVAGDDLVHLIVTVLVRNIGESKAFIGRTSGTLITRQPNEALGDYDDYSSLDLPERVIAPDQLPVPIKVYCFPTITAPTFAECLEKGTFTLYFFGFIEYNTLGFNWRKEFGYDWKIIDRDSSLGGLYGLSDPYPNSLSPRKAASLMGTGDPTKRRISPSIPHPTSRTQQTKRQFRTLPSGRRSAFMEPDQTSWSSKRRISRSAMDCVSAPAARPSGLAKEDCIACMSSKWRVATR